VDCRDRGWHRLGRHRPDSCRPESEFVGRSLQKAEREGAAAGLSGHGASAVPAARPDHRMAAGKSRSALTRECRATGGAGRRPGGRTAMRQRPTAAAGGAGRLRQHQAVPHLPPDRQRRRAGAVLRLASGDAPAGRRPGTGHPLDHPARRFIHRHRADWHRASRPEDPEAPDRPRLALAAEDAGPDEVRRDERQVDLPSLGGSR
jgi:hypothetical protein